MAVKMDTLPCHTKGHTHASATCASALALPAWLRFGVRVSGQGQG